MPVLPVVPTPPKMTQSDEPAEQYAEWLVSIFRPLIVTSYRAGYEQGAADNTAGGSDVPRQD